jgi:hypothetical protein
VLYKQGVSILISIIIIYKYSNYILIVFKNRTIYIAFVITLTKL